MATPASMNQAAGGPAALRTSRPHTTPDPVVRPVQHPALAVEERMVLLEALGVHQEPIEKIGALEGADRQ